MKRDRCGCCGGTEFVDAVDNRGRPYKGCARCVIVLPRELPSNAPESKSNTAHTTTANANAASARLPG